MTEDENTRNQGEGNREAAGKYNEATQKFAKSGKVQDAAERAAEESGEADREAEQQGKARAKELDPEVHRDYDKPRKD